MQTVRLGREWRLGAAIGEGGFAQVFDAQPVSGDDPAAVIKLVPKAPGAHRELLFEELAGAPNIVPIIDKGEWCDNWVLVMPRAEKSLRHYLVENGGKLPIDKALNVLVDVVEAIVGLEGRVVHRDLKPENILLLDGRWCLADFGIARYAEATTAPDTRKYAMSRPYASPEQWRGERATSATDVYATGVIAYELLAGRRPFLGPEPHQYRRQHLEETPAPIPDVPAALEQVVLECLFKAHQARPTPHKLLSRLSTATQPLSAAAQRLQQAYGRQVELRAEDVRRASADQSQGERRGQLFISAKEGLSRLVATLREQIEDAAPGSASSVRLPFSCTMGKATLTINSATQASRRPVKTRYEAPIEVVAYSRITLEIPPDPWAYEGRAHSLWYCDAQQEGVFRWYETAFMVNALIPKRGRKNPFAMDPEDEAFGALSPVMTEFQPAWPFTLIDQGDEADFIERWIGWLADAAEGRLHHPRTMPERDPRDSWRRN